MGKKAPAALERQHLLLNHRIHFLLCYDILISLGFATKTLQLCRNQDKSDSQQNQRRVFVRPFLRYRAALQQMTTGNWTHFSNCRLCRIHQSKKKKKRKKLRSTGQNHSSCWIVSRARINSTLFLRMDVAWNQSGLFRGLFSHRCGVAR